MIDREKVVEGLECCSVQSVDRDCDVCPIGFGEGCALKLKRDALALLKAQGPRVMTLEEARKDIEIWYESVNGACGWGDLCYDTNLELALYTTHGIKGVKEGTYGKTWRCWTSRPTDEQREAVKWE